MTSYLVYFWEQNVVKRGIYLLIIENKMLWQELTVYIII